MPTSQGVNIHRIMHEKAIARCTLISQYESQALKAQAKVCPQMDKLYCYYLVVSQQELIQ